MKVEEQIEHNRKTHTKIDDAIKEIEEDSRKIRLLLGVVDYDAPHLLHYNVSLHLPPYCNAKFKVFDFLIRIDMLKTITILEQK